MTRLSFQDKVVLITGASSGFGQETARLFAKEGARLILLARRRERLLELQQELQQAYHTQSEIIVGDIVDFKTLKKEWERVHSLLETPDILINNAGLVRGLDKVWEITPDKWNEVIDTNIKGILNMTHLVLPAMLKANKGHIINLGSISGHETYPGGGVYCATKYAVRALTETLRKELVSTPIRVSLVSPGMAKTEFSLVRFYGDEGQSDQVYQGIDALTPTDIAETILFIASRPPHVNIADIVLYPTNQAAAHLVHRRSD